MRKTTTIYDLAGIGIGPFNLGLAALCQPIHNLNTIFIDQKKKFNWHAGMLIPGTSLQVPYMADLVRLADPCSPWSYLNYLRKQNRLLQFGVHETGYLTRSEYNRYCQWVAGQLPNLLFGYRVTDINYDPRQDIFELHYSDTVTNSPKVLKAHRLVMGLGSVPRVPATIQVPLCDRIFHSSNYLMRKPQLQESRHIVLVGSGQSAAEIFYDLLETIHPKQCRLSWLTRSDRLFSMEHHKFAYEMAAPDYIDFFYGLPDAQKQSMLNGQHSLYKGINHQLLNAIHDRLYETRAEGAAVNCSIHTNSELRFVTPKSHTSYELGFHHTALQKSFTLKADRVILATGYQPAFPCPHLPLPYPWHCSSASDLHINRNYAIDDANRVFVQNAELHTHGFNAADLGLGPYRNATIINAILGTSCYPVHEQTGFQHFGIPREFQK